MSIEIRPLTEDELPAMRQVTRYAFANPPGGPEAPMIPEWTTCAFVDGRLATTFAAYPFRVRLNGASVAMAGVTAVATLPEYRRLGLLRRIMTRSFGEQREQGFPIAILWASRGAIYQRYGYGMATPWVGYRIDPREIRFTRGASASGRVRIVPMDEARKTIEQMYREFSRPRNLMIQRAPAMWNVRLPQDAHAGLYGDTGYVVFTLKQEPGTGQVLAVGDMAYLDADAYRGLWEFFASHDIVARVDLGPVAEDDPIQHMLQEPRELNRHTRDGVWMRVTDVESALQQRRYGDEGMLTVKVVDELCDWNDATFSIETNGTETLATRVAMAEPELTMDVSTLAVLLAGHRNAIALTNAGLVESTGDKPLRTAERMFSARYAPWCADGF